jgi:hypothetical protein
MRTRKCSHATVMTTRKCFISYSVRDTLESTARAQVEHNRRARRVFAQAAARAAELDGYEPSVKSLGLKDSMRNRSGSAASYTTATSDSGEVESLPSGYSYNSGLSSSSNTHRSGASSSGSTSTFSASSPTPTFSYSNPASALSPIASRVREHDANAMEAYNRRNRSGSGSTDVRTAEFPSPAAHLGNAPIPSEPSVNGDNIASLPGVRGSVAPRRRLRPSSSAAQLRSHTRPPFIVTIPAVSQDFSPRNRAGTNPTTKLPGSPRSPLTDTFGPVSSAGWALPSRNSSLNALSISQDDAETERFVGPSSDYAVFPDPPEEDPSPTVTPTVTNTPTRHRLPFHILSKPLPLPSIDLHHGHGHRRGSSIHSLR